MFDDDIGNHTFTSGFLNLDTFRDRLPTKY
jgi:hypothetical protein